MRIKTNSLLETSNKNITMVNNCLFAKEGPNCVGKMDLSSLSINYDSFFSSNMILQPNDTDKPIMYGFLGTNVTFLSIIPNYNINPQMCPGDNYIEYYFEDQPTIKMTFTEILMLSGNDLHRIPQIYLTNPNDSIINLEIMVANINVNEISNILNPEYNEIVGLSYNYILSDQIYGINTGSTQFEILDILDSGVTQMIISYNNIEIMELLENSIIVTTKADGPIKLTFNSLYHTLQAYSRMNWVVSNQTTRFLTMAYPTIDLFSPVITFKIDPLITTLPITKSTLNYKYIESVIDNRDGVINNSNVAISIINNINGDDVDEIIEDSEYTIIFTISDIAANKTVESKTLLVDSTAPEIHFNPNLFNQMDLSATTQTPGTILTDDLIRYYIDYVQDAIDGIISNSALTIEVINSGGTNIYPIVEIGDYNVSFSISDRKGNQTTETRNLRVIDNTYQSINYQNSCDNSDYIYMRLDNSVSGTEITIGDLSTFALSSVTDAYGTEFSSDYINISPTSIFPIGSNDDYDITFTVDGLSSTSLSEIKTLRVLANTDATFNLNPVFTGTSNSSFTMNLYDDPILSAITQQDIVLYAISGITDICGHSNIDINDIFITGVNFPLTTVADYSLVFNYTDYKNDTVTINKVLTVGDKSVPEIIFNDVFINERFIMSISSDTANSTTIEESDVINYAISAATDDYYGDVDINITKTLRNYHVSSMTPNIQNIPYNIVFIATDQSGNSISITKELLINA